MSDTIPIVPSSLAVLSVAEMYAADKAAESAGIASIDLMEAAGAAIARVVQARWPRQTVVVLCGPGYNGGDGFVAARLLTDAGWDVRLALLGAVSDLRGDAAANAKRWQGKVQPLSPALLDGRPLVIDALFGAGLKRGLSGAARAVVERINAENLTCIAVDVPSGVHGDTGQILKSDDGAEIAPRCAASVTFFRPKPGHMLYPGRALCGDITVADIGIPAAVLDSIRPRTAVNAPGLWFLPQPSWSDHKYHRGNVIVVGGERITGASRLAARAARRAGAGLLTLAVPSSVLPIYAASEPGCFAQPLDNPADFDALLADKRRNGVLIGPGAGLGMETQVRVLKILATERAAVLDADALTSFQDDPAQLFSAIKRRVAPVVITPHEGEFARLFPNATSGGKLAHAREAAAASGAIVILKGPDTVIAAPPGKDGGRAALATNAPPWLATGGSGDVLAGFVIGLMVQGMPGWEAACAAVWLHGAVAALLGRGLIAEDLPEALPKVLKSL